MPNKRIVSVNSCIGTEVPFRCVYIMEYTYATASINVDNVEVFVERDFDAVR